MNRLKATLYALFIILTRRDWTLSSHLDDTWTYTSSKGKLYSHSLRVVSLNELKEEIRRTKQNEKTINTSDTPTDIPTYTTVR